MKFFSKIAGASRGRAAFSGQISTKQKAPINFLQSFFHVFCFYHLKNFLKYDKIVKIYAIEEEKLPSIILIGNRREVEMLFGKHINRYYVKHLPVLLLGIVALIVVD